MRFHVSLISAILFSSLTSFASVWPTVNQWSPQFETKYSEWIRLEWQEDTFTSPNSMLQGIETDCADSVYAARATFSFLNQLPFKTAGGLANSTSQFDNVQKGPSRFRSFLKVLMRETSSRTLPADTYSIALNPQAFRPGIIYVAPGNHSYLIKDVQPDGMITTYSSTMPIAVRLLMRLEGVPFYIPQESFKHTDGYRAFRQPEQLGLNQEKLPNYSDEQYTLAAQSKNNYIQFAELLTQKISIEKPTLQKKIEHTLNSLCSFAQERGAWVSLSSSLWASNKKCMSSSQVEDYSTVSRDQKLVDFFQYLRQLVGNDQYNELSPEIKDKVISVFTGEGQSGCLVNTFDPRLGSIKLSDVWIKIVQKKLISSPHATIAQRWGFQPWIPICEK